MGKDYVTLYKYVSINYLVDILNNQRLYLNDGTNFNDPFEITVTNKKNGIKYMEGLHILSLTNSHLKKLMWSYYADSHKGACLTVQVPKALVHPICYSSKRIYDNSDVDKIIASSIRVCKKNVNKDISSLSKDKKIAYIKDKKWIYEKEYRIVFDENDEDILTFDKGKWFMPVKITNIYLGVNFFKNDKKIQSDIREACELNKVEIKQVVLSDLKYSLKVQL